MTNNKVAPPCNLLVSAVILLASHDLTNSQGLTQKCYLERGLGSVEEFVYHSQVLSPPGPDASLCHDVVCADILALFDVWAQWLQRNLSGILYRCWGLVGEGSRPGGPPLYVPTDIVLSLTIVTGAQLYS